MLAVCIVALGWLAILSAGCAGGAANTSEGSRRPAATTNTAPSSTIAGATATVCGLVRTGMAVVGTSSTLPIGDGQRLLAEAEGSGNRQLNTEALALAAASHTLDTKGVAHALQQMSETCRSLGQ